MAKNKRYSTEIISKIIEDINNNEPFSDYSPFYNKDTDYKQADLSFDLTPEEINELVVCSDNIRYFSEKYGKLMTDEGIRTVQLRNYQHDMLDMLQRNRENVILASRQVGKCISFLTKITVRSNKKIQTLSIGSLYYLLLSKQRKLSLFEYFYHLFYKLYDMIDI